MSEGLYIVTTTANAYVCIVVNFEILISHTEYQPANKYTDRIHPPAYISKAEIDPRPQNMHFRGKFKFQ